MPTYYNEIEPFAAEWLKKLIDAGHIAPGEVDTRSIREVDADDLKGFDQCHFFAGIGGWSLAARIAGIPDDFPIWTGSCPCQSFSSAGKQKGAEDERHLWPVFAGLIQKCSPAVVAGEQVANAIGHNWFDLVSTDLEAEGYAVGAAVLGSHSVGKDHQRQRLYWVGKLAYADQVGRWQEDDQEQLHEWINQDDATLRVDDTEIKRTPNSAKAWKPNAERTGWGGGMANGYSRRFSSCEESNGKSLINTIETSRRRDIGRRSRLILCRDGKARRISSQPGDEPLAHGIPRSLGRGESKLRRMEIATARTNRTGRLRGYGNAIDPRLAAEFLIAALT